MSVDPHIPDTAKTDAPAVLLPYQREWLDDTAKLKVSEKSRRTGLTWAEAADDVLIAASSKAAGGQNVYYIGYNQDMAIEYIEACAMWARVFDRAASSVEEGIWEEDEADKHIKTFTIKFPDSGHRIVALSSRPANLRGKQGVVVIDEAAFHEKLDQLLKAALALLIWGGKVRVISTHNGDENPFNELIQEVRAGKRRGTVHQITFQEAVRQGLYQRVCLRLGEEWTPEGESRWVQEVYDFYGDDAQEELDVVPSQSAGSFLSRVLIESRMDRYPVVRLAKKDDFGGWPLHLRTAEIRDWCDTELLPLLQGLDPEREHCLGEDFARSGDLTVIAPMEVGQDLVRRTQFLVELRNIPFAQQQQILFYIMDRLPRLRSAALDARGNGQQLAEAAADRYGSALVHQVMLSDKWYSEAMPGFKAAFEDGDIEIPQDQDVLDDLRLLQVINGVPKLPKASGQGEEKRHGDAAIALALAWFASKQEGAPIEYQSTGTTRAGAERLPQADTGFGAVAGNVDTRGF
jgi:phage FluMu gp28-like protein